jgi:hypothetical protein
MHRQEGNTMSDDPNSHDAQQPQPPLEDHEQPTRRISRVEAGSLDETQIAQTATPPSIDLPDSEVAEAEGVSLADLLNAPPDEDTYAAEAETVVSSVPDLPDLPPSRSYNAQLPHVPGPPPQQPPVYGGLADGGARQRAVRRTRVKARSGLYLPWWSLVILVVIVAGVSAALFVGLNLLGGQFSPGGETPVVIIITSTPSPQAAAPITRCDQHPAGHAGRFGGPADGHRAGDRTSRSNLRVCGAERDTRPIRLHPRAGGL